MHSCRDQELGRVAGIYTLTCIPLMCWNSSGGLLSSDRHRISAAVECCTTHSTIAIKMSNTVHLSTNNPTID